MSILLLILGLVLFIGLVVVHEWGHFIMARRGGVEVEEFGIGFPPKAKTIARKNGTEYTLNWLPLGGFVRLKGEHDADKKKGSFGAAPLSTKIKIMVAGVVMNLITAYVMLILLSLVGLPKLVDNQFTVKNDEHLTQRHFFAGYIEPDSPAAKAGLKAQDIIESIGPVDGAQRTITSTDAFPSITKNLAGQKVDVEYRRDDVLQKTQVQLRSSEEVEASKKTDNPKGYLGVAPGEYVVNRYTWSAPIVAGGTIVQFTELTFKGLGTALGGLFTGHAKQASEQVSGPVGIFVILQQGTHLGIQFILMVIAVISLTLAIMNVLPIPALDGGRLFVTLIYRTIKKPLTEKAEDIIHGTGFAVLMLLFVLITIVDVKRFF
jgi:regulator of sigma E protease